MKKVVLEILYETPADFELALLRAAFLVRSGVVNTKRPVLSGYVRLCELHDEAKEPALPRDTSPQHQQSA